MIKRLSSLAARLGFENQEAMLDFCLRIDEFYYTKIDLKRKGIGWKARILNPSKGTLKLVQKKISKLLHEIEMPQYVQGSRKGRGSVSNARLHQGNKEFFVTDLKDFFPSINNRRVYEAFAASGFSPDVSRVLTTFTTFRGKVPQGAPTSSGVANLCFLEIDSRLSSIANAYGITYTRYVDDLVFSSPRAFIDLSQTIISVVAAGGFKVSRKKTHYKRGPMVVTGAIVRNNGLAITPKTQKKLNCGLISEKSKRGLLAYKKQVETA